MSFKPFLGYVEVSPLTSTSSIASDDKIFVEKAKVLQVGGGLNGYEIEVGDIIFFRPHGFFELNEHEDKKKYVVRVDLDFILGVFKSNVGEKQV